MADKELTVRFILKWEGGYVDDKDDAGGATMKGVTLKTYRKYFGNDRTKDDLRKITMDEWDYIFTKCYWNKAKCYRIKNDRIAMLVADMVWMSGLYLSIKNIQKCLGCVADGIIGPKTLESINNNDPTYVFETLFEMRKQWLYRIAEKGNNRKFLKGWLNRLNALRTFE